MSIISEIRLPGQSPGNPLVTLAQALSVTNKSLATICDHLRSIAVAVGGQTTEATSLHLYAVAPKNDDSWGTFCIGCSQVAHEYIYPCERFTGNPKPPEQMSATTS